MGTWGCKKGHKSQRELTTVAEQTAYREGYDAGIKVGKVRAAELAFDKGYAKGTKDAAKAWADAQIDFKEIEEENEGE